MKVMIELTEAQKHQVLRAACAVLTQDQQRTLALRVFHRNENIDPFPALAAVCKQIMRQHCLTRKNLLDMLRNELS